MDQPYKFEKTLFSDAHTKLVELLRKARKDAGLTQVDVAQALNSRQVFISKIECCERKIDVIEFLVLCKVYKADPAALLKKLNKYTKDFLPKKR